MYKTVTLLSSVGIILACYLLYEYLAADPLEACRINAIINCEAVTKGSLAEIFGIPVSLVGLVGYIVILFSSVKKIPKLMVAMTTFGMLFCLRLTYLEIFVENVICPVCIICQLIMLTVFIISLKLVFSEKKASSEHKK